MKKRINYSLLLSIAACSAIIAQAPVNMGDRRELFLDNFLIEKKEGLILRMHEPKNEGIVLHMDKPWEGLFSLYSTVLKDGNKYRMYYRGLPIVIADGSTSERTCYAESEDGIHWTKPDIGLFEVEGSTKNNVILANAAPVTHNFSPFIDKNPDAPSDERYKAIGGTEISGLVAYVSPDGIRWRKKQEGAVFSKGIFDSQNVAFWSESEKQYVCYFRTWSDGAYKEVLKKDPNSTRRYFLVRSVSRTTSRDFINWTTPVEMTFGDTPYEELYTHQTSPYFRAPHLYVAIGARFMPNRQVLTKEQAMEVGVNLNFYKDCSDAIIMSTRGGNVFDRTFMESFIRPGIGLRNWVSRSNYPVLNVIPTSPEEMSLYVNEDYAQPTSHIKRYTLRTDGFSSLYADYKGGEMISKLLTFEGKKLEINYSTSAAGEIRIALQDIHGNPIPGFSLNDCQPIIGNEIGRIVSWEGKDDIGSLASKDIRLKIVMKDADLFSIKFNH